MVLISLTSAHSGRPGPFAPTGGVRSGRVAHAPRAGTQARCPAGFESVERCLVARVASAGKQSTKEKQDQEQEEQTSAHNKSR